MTSRRHGVRRWRLLLAAVLTVGLPAAAYVAAPAQAGSVAKAPAADLAGFNSEATSAGVQLQLLVPGLVPLGNPTKGNFIQASVPYADSTSSTGPSNGSVASPVWPGDAIATAGNALQTFSASIPQALVNLLNDPVVARSDYPAQVKVGETGSFTPTGPAGIGSATTKSTAAGSIAMAASSDLSPLGSSAKSGVPLIDIASATSSTSTNVQAASVADQAETHIGHITIAGLITIDGINTTASASSDGKDGTSSATTDIGAVKIAGLAASIGPDGITLNGKGSQGGTGVLVKTANKLLTSLQKAGVSITTLVPQQAKDGNEADATSGAVLVSFEDANLPDFGKVLPQLPIPTPNSVGVELSIGLSQAKAAATRQPPDEVPPSTSIPAPSSPGTGVIAPGPSGGLPPVDTGTGPIVGGGAPIVATAPTATEFGLPVRTAWVVIALLIAVFAAGPLLTYANWQLLRGRTP
ncbi:MAG TPA: hypothetical protein VHV76_14755 [Mycobacteriales bacterium]|nr:hypothetical protein [Mycobacteriales bacterium]